MVYPARVSVQLRSTPAVTEPSHLPQYLYSCVQLLLSPSNRIYHSFCTVASSSCCHRAIALPEFLYNSVLTPAVTEPSHIPRSVGVHIEFRVRSARNILTEQNYNSSGKKYRCSSNEFPANLHSRRVLMLLQCRKESSSSFLYLLCIKVHQNGQKRE